MKVAQIQPGASDISLVVLPQRLLLRLETRRPPDDSSSDSSSSSDSGPATTMVVLVAGDETGTVRVVLWDAAAALVCPAPAHALTPLPLVLRRCRAAVFDGRVELRLLDGDGTVALLVAETAGVPAPPATVNTAVDVSATLWEPTALSLP